MNNFKISTRLIILIGLLSMLLVAIGSFGLFGISKSNDALKSVYDDRTVPMGQIAEINQMNLINRLLIAGSLLDPNPNEVSKGMAGVEANLISIDKVWSEYMATTLTPEESRIAKKLSEDRAQFEKEGASCGGGLSRQRPETAKHSPLRFARLHPRQRRDSGADEAPDRRSPERIQRSHEPLQHHPHLVDWRHCGRRVICLLFWPDPGARHFPLAAAGD
jgi:hypothetical protein